MRIEMSAISKAAFWRGCAVSLIGLAVHSHAQNSLLDSTFNPGTGAAGGLVESVLIQPDGKILICGSFTSFNGVDRSYVARLNPDGSVDRSFLAHPSYWTRYMALQADGKILIGGFFTSVDGQSRNLIARLNPTGSLDPTFDPGAGASGTLSVSITGNGDPFVFQIAVQTDGKILITGNFTSYNRATANGIARLNPDGSLDNSFQMGSGFDRWGRSIMLQANGQIVITGWFNNYNNHNANHMIRLNPDGTMDTSFTPFFGDQTSVYQAVLLPDGKYVVTGHSLVTNRFQERIRRLNPDGSVDTTFKASADEKVEFLRMQSDGKFIIGGYFGTVDGVHRTGIARLNPDGSLDNTLAASIDNFVWTVAFASEDKLVICGGFNTVDGQSRINVARLKANSNGAVTPVPPPPDPTPNPNPSPSPIPSPLPGPVVAHWANNKLSLAVPTIAGKTYAVSYKSSLSDANWMRLFLFQGDGSTNVVVDSAANGPHRFYRIYQY